MIFCTTLYARQKCVPITVELSMLLSYQMLNKTSTSKTRGSERNNGSSRKRTIRSDSNGEEGQWVGFVSNSPKQPSRTLRPFTPLVVVDETTSLINDDLLRYIFQFFASASGTIDAPTVRSLMLVSKRFSKVARGKHLWRIATGHYERMAPLPITCSLLLHEQRGGDRFDVNTDIQEREISCLFGFVNVCEITLSDPSSWAFEARERCSGKLCYFLIHNRYNKRAHIIKETFANHYLTSESFLSDQSSAVSQFQFSVLRGIHFLSGGRLLQWYDKDESLFRDLNCYRALRSIEDGHDRMIIQVKHFLHKSVDCLHHLLRLEQDISFSNSVTRRLNQEHRATLVDWIVEITDVFDLEDNALHRAVSFLDRYVDARSIKSISTRHYQLVAGVCLGIASKCEGRMLSETDICLCADNTFDAQNVREKEDDILLALNWKLAFPTLLDFVNEYEQLSAVTAPLLLPKSLWIKRFLSEMALQCPLVSFTRRPSITAACIVSLAAFLTEEPIWPSQLEEATGYKWFDLEDCMIELCNGIQWVETAVPGLTMIKRRYSKLKRALVAEGFRLPRLSSFSMLTEQRIKSLSA